MEELPPLVPGAAEIELFVLEATIVALVVGVAVASYRRSRCLSGYPIWRSGLIAVLAGKFWMVWLVVWWVNWDRIAEEWRVYRQARESAETAAV